jgi:predicted RNA binding protein YcfA (HicA-like mRNA interferase family)
MKLPRDVSGADLIRSLRELGYVPTRQTGSQCPTDDGAQGRASHHRSSP